MGGAPAAFSIEMPPVTLVHENTAVTRIPDTAKFDDKQNADKIPKREAPFNRAVFIKSLRKLQ